MTKLNQEQVASLSCFVQTHSDALSCVVEAYLEQEELQATQEIKECDTVEEWIEYVLKETMYGQILAIAYESAEAIIDELIRVWDEEKAQQVISTIFQEL